MAQDIATPIDMLNRYIFSPSGGGATTYTRSTVQVDDGDYDGTLTVYFEIVAQNAMAATTWDVTLTESGGDKVTITVPANVTAPTRYRSGSFTLSSGATDYQIKIDNTAVANDGQIYSASIIIQQVGATKSKVWFPLHGDSAGTTTDTGVGGAVVINWSSPFQTGDGSQHYPWFNKDTKDYFGATLTYKLEARWKSNGGSAAQITHITLWNETDDTQVVASEMTKPGPDAGYAWDTLTIASDATDFDDDDRFALRSYQEGGASGEFTNIFLTITVTNIQDQFRTWWVVGKDTTATSQTPGIFVNWRKLYDADAWSSPISAIEATAWESTSGNIWCSLFDASTNDSGTSGSELTDSKLFFTSTKNLVSSPIAPITDESRITGYVDRDPDGELVVAGIHMVIALGVDAFLGSGTGGVDAGEGVILGDTFFQDRPVDGMGIQVDWDDNGDFFGPNEDVTSRVLEAQWNLGRDFASQLTSKSSAGRLTVLLQNDDGLYNSFNTSSAIVAAGNLKPGRPVRVTLTVNQVRRAAWQGHLESIEPLPGLGGIHKALLRGVGPLAKVRERVINLPMSTSISTGAAVNKVLDEAGWPATGRDVEAGLTIMTRWWAEQELSALTALQELEDDEGLGGFLAEGKDGKIRFLARDHRSGSASQVTFQDSTTATYRFMGVQQIDPLQEIFNRAEVTVIGYNVATVATLLWQHPEAGIVSPGIGSGETLTTSAVYPNDGSASNAAAVDVWTTPVAQTDYTLNSQADGGGTDLTGAAAVTVNKLDTVMEISIRNDSGQTAYLTKLQARGTSITTLDPTILIAEDATSQTAYGERTYPIPAKHITDTDTAQTYIDAVINRKKDPHPILTIRFSAKRDTNHEIEARDRDLSDKITVTATGQSKLGINEDFYVEAIRHRVTEGALRHIVEYDLSAATATPESFQLGTGELGDNLTF